ncbi:serine hydrolase domain-containing protein [Actinomadura algeriensis]|uniref:CubicO group peptidase (Beta-lactamase class C family) n=1 Tax=Actinomadura algeriensis TaxID=1679523 RepID=A0ABR9JLB6_9ACTN|nr:serine hydrolase domain-containing protein [Actinomadura algeriensis]MBE1531239.1 CubicO group peptidase (beta-lactamase class C family) [Actinomadura algeriensis]
MPDRLRRALAGHVEKGDVPGLVALVRRDGETRATVLGSMSAGGGAPMRRDAPFRIASLTKPVTAAAAMLLVEDGRLRLDDPVDDLLPELAAPRVLRRPDGPLDDTVPAGRAITVGDLLTFRLGIGRPMRPCPLGDAMAAAGVAVGPDAPAMPADEYLRRLGALPLAHPPGERWLYDTGSNVLGVLIARAAGRPLGEFCRERIFEPLGMRGTGFHVASGETHRLPVSYAHDASGALSARDDPRDRPPAFESGSAGLVCPADDLAAFFQMMLDGGGPVLSRESVASMLTDRLTPEQKAAAEPFLGEAAWGLGVAIEPGGRFGWVGGLGTIAFADPSAGLVAVLFTQVMVDWPGFARLYDEFREFAYDTPASP